MADKQNQINLFDLIFNGTAEYLARAEKLVAETIATHSPDTVIKLPETAYALPVIYAVTGEKIETVGDLNHAMELAKDRIGRTRLLQSALKAGVASGMLCEIIQACKYVDGKPHPEWVDGHLSDAIVRSFGVDLVTQDIPGVAVIIGEHENPEKLAEIIKSYQNKGLQTYLVGKSIDQAREQKIKMGVDLRVIPCGYDIEDVINVVSVAVRASLMFGNTPPGDWEKQRIYTRDHIMAFVNVFDHYTDKIIAAGACAIELGFPAIVEDPIPEVPTLLLVQPDHDKTVATSLEARGIKVKVTEINCPVSVSSAFEGERVRKGDMKGEFGGNRTKSWELVRTSELGDVEDHKIEIIGKNIDDPSFADTGLIRMPLGIDVQVAGKAMQTDFESVLERRLHYWLNFIEGVMHVGQRNINWIRISKEAVDAGFTLEHLGEVIYAKILDEFDKVVDKVQVTIYTNEEDVVRIEEELVKPIYSKRDDRLASLTDENVDVFYTCTLCQSFAPSHVCVVTPERLGLCGAVSWLDSKATKELDPTGPAQPIEKKRVIDEHMGKWEEVNEVVAKCSQGAVDNVSLYSILEDPMTSCGCFECICGIMPEANGVIIVNREFPDMTPSGMTFGELASLTGGGVQTPGFMGHGRHFISSKKFMAAEGGLERIVWMPKELKDDVAERLNKSVFEMTGIENFTDMVCDETIASDSEAVCEWLAEKGHPALEMDAIM